MNTTVQQHQKELDIINIPNTASTAVQSDITTAPFIHHVFLTNLNLAVNAEFHFLICQLCKEAIPTSMTRGHLVNKHSELLHAFHQEQFNKVAGELQLAQCLPTSISGPRSIVHGLAVHDALACDQCQTVLTKAKNMRYHHHHHHSNTMVPDKWRACKAQRMKAEGAGSQRTFWEVMVEEETRVQTSKDVMTAKLMEELNKQLENDVQAPTDHRLVSPWLRTTRWHEYVAGSGFSTDQLRRSIALPRPNEADYKELHTILEDYFQGALALMDTTDELVLQRLNSPDPAKG